MTSFRGERGRSEWPSCFCHFFPDSFNLKQSICQAAKFGDSMSWSPSVRCCSSLIWLIQKLIMGKGSSRSVGLQTQDHPQAPPHVGWWEDLCLLFSYCILALKFFLSLISILPNLCQMTRLNSSQTLVPITWRLRCPLWHQLVSGQPHIRRGQGESKQYKYLIANWEKWHKSGRKKSVTENKGRDQLREGFRERPSWGGKDKLTPHRWEEPVKQVKSWGQDTPEFFSLAVQGVLPLSSPPRWKHPPYTFYDLERTDSRTTYSSHYQDVCRLDRHSEWRAAAADDDDDDDDYNQ